MRRELREAATEELALPEVIGERCVHSLMEQASCRACVEACPRGAWVIDSDMLGIDTTRCDGCDLCAAACPQGAIEGRFSPSLKITDKGGAAFATCERAGVEGCIEGLVPCLHAIGIADLLRLYRQGATFLITSRGDCDKCDRGRGERLSERVAQVNRLLESRGMGAIKFRNLAPDGWGRALSRLGDLVAERTLDRRSFFRRAVEGPRKRVEAALEDLDPIVPPGMLLSCHPEDSLFPFVPSIDQDRCSGCDACSRLCPQGAIRLEREDSGALAYLIDAKRCSACGMCVDVCEANAVRIKSWIRLSNNTIPLRDYRCHSCGIEFHLPDDGRDPEAMCWVCGKANHQKNLFQVLD